MQNKLHRAMEMLNKGEDPTLIVEFLDGVRRGIEDKTKSTPAQKAIAELESNPDLISEVVRDVAKRMFGGGVKESRSATVTWPK